MAVWIRSGILAMSAGLLVFGTNSSGLAQPSCEATFLITPSGWPGQSSVITTERELVDGIRRHAKNGIEFNGLPIVQFRRALRRAVKRDATMALLDRAFRDKKVTFAMDRDATVRRAILEANAFLNLHQTGTSSGAPHTGKREAVESELFGIPRDQYEQLPPAWKPKSLYLVPDKDSGLALEPTLYALDENHKEHTGDTWVFDREAIAKNTFFVVGDSLNRTLIERELAQDLAFFSPGENSHLPKNHIADYALPIELLDTAIPYYYNQVKKEGRFRFVNEKDPAYTWLIEQTREDMGGQLSRMQEILFSDYLPPEFNQDRGDFFRRFPEFLPLEPQFFFKPFANYTEGLYVGELPVRGKVKELIFRSNPPTEDEMRLLKAAGIKVTDGRKKQN
jgi:hypothetical protein